MNTVTTVVPVRNREKFIIRALESVYAQTLPATEVVVVDDASTDNTPQVVENLAKKWSNLSLVRLTENVGQAKARNIGAEVARGDLLAFLDSDDRWYSQKLEKQIDEFRSNKDVVAVLCGALETTQDCSFVHIPRAEISLKTLYRSNAVGAACSTIVVAKQAFAQIGGFDTALPSSTDWDLCLRLAEIGKIRVVREELIEYCRHTGDRISNNKATVVDGYNIIFNKIYDRLPRTNNPFLIRIIKGSHEATLARFFCSHEPRRALRHVLKALALAPSPRKLRLCGEVAKNAAQSELRRLRKAVAR